MIISASRRTDIPAFYSQWFMNRIRAGCCEVPNPFNPSQIASISLRPEDVDVIVFWTRDPRPMMPHLRELNERGFLYYFLYTVMDNPSSIDPHGPPVTTSLHTFRALADRIGPARLIWRYDPIAFTPYTDPEFHEHAFRHIAEGLKGHTNRCIISTINLYRKTWNRLARKGIRISPPEERAFKNLMLFIVREARDKGMEICSCAMPLELDGYGIKHGKCVDDSYISKVFGTEVTHRKDPSQRKACGCVISKDIGMYDTCLFGCLYCYATSSVEKARENRNKHDPESPRLVC
jgi:hypothetical protein